MEVSVEKANMSDCQLIYELQVESFKDLLDKYQDFETNPAAESLERIKLRMMQEFTDYYLICLNDKKIGAVRILKLDNDVFRISPIFILPNYRGNGYAKQSIHKLETLYPNAKKWEVATIKQERKLCCFYESLGYKSTETETQIQDNMTIIEYSKEVKK